MLYLHGVYQGFAEAIFDHKDNEENSQEKLNTKIRKSFHKLVEDKDVDDETFQGMAISLLTISLRINETRGDIYTLNDIDETSRSIVKHLSDKYKDELELKHFIKKGTNPLFEVDESLWGEAGARHNQVHKDLKSIVSRRRAASAAKGAWDAALDYLKRPWEAIDPLDFMNVAIERGASAHDIVHLQQIYESFITNSPTHSQHETPWTMKGVPYDARYEGQDIWDELRRATETIDYDTIESCLESLKYNCHRRNMHPYYIPGWRSLLESAIGYVKGKMSDKKHKKFMKKMDERNLLVICRD